MNELLYLTSFALGIVCGFPMYKIIKRKVELILTLIFFPYALLMFFSDLYPDMGFWRFLFFMWGLGILIVFAMKERRAKKESPGK